MYAPVAVAVEMRVLLRIPFADSRRSFHNLDWFDIPGQSSSIIEIMANSTEKYLKHLLQIHVAYFVHWYTN
jgi:hypothetical protein